MNRPRTRRRPRPRFGRAGLQGRDAQSLLPTVHQNPWMKRPTDDEYEDDSLLRLFPIQPRGSPVVLHQASRPVRWQPLPS